MMGKRTRGLSLGSPGSGPDVLLTILEVRTNFRIVTDDRLKVKPESNRIRQDGYFHEGSYLSCPQDDFDTIFLHIEIFLCNRKHSSTQPVANCGLAFYWKPRTESNSRLGRNPSLA